MLADMLLVSGGMSALVKAQGLVYPAFQLVFIRAMIGLLFILPRHRYHVRHTRHPWKDTSRISCNAIALTSQFTPYTVLPRAASTRGAAFAFAGVLVMWRPAASNGTLACSPCLPGLYSAWLAYAIIVAMLATILMFIGRISA